MTLNCELCQSDVSVLSIRLIIELSKIGFLCTLIDQMIIKQRFNVLLQHQFSPTSVFSKVSSDILRILSLKDRSVPIGAFKNFIGHIAAFCLNIQTKLRLSIPFFLYNFKSFSMPLQLTQIIQISASFHTSVERYEITLNEFSVIGSLNIYELLGATIATNAVKRNIEKKHFRQK